MPVSVFLKQTRSIVGDLYRVANEITTSSGIVKEVFVKRESNYEYDRVATLQDILTLPTTPDPHAGYFRASSFHKDFLDVSEANYFGQGIKNRLDSLVQAYEDTVNHFLGDDQDLIISE